MAVRIGAIVAKTESGTINLKSGTINVKCGTINSESGTIKPKSGTINFIARVYDKDSQDLAVLSVIAENPGIKRDRICFQVQTSIRSVQRTVECLVQADKIEYRGSRRTGGWFVKT